MAVQCAILISGTSFFLSFQSFEHCISLDFVKCLGFLLVKSSCCAHPSQNMLGGNPSMSTQNSRFRGLVRRLFAPPSSVAPSSRMRRIGSGESDRVHRLEPSLPFDFLLLLAVRLTLSIARSVTHCSQLLAAAAQSQSRQASPTCGALCIEINCSVGRMFVILIMWFVLDECSLKKWLLDLLQHQHQGGLSFIIKNSG